MAYSIPLGKSAPFLDETGTPIPEGVVQVTIADTSIANIEGGHPDALHLRGLALGPTDVTVNGVTHTVTVVASTFDWSLGAPV